MEDDTLRVIVQVICAAVVAASVILHVVRTNRDDQRRRDFLADVERRLRSHRLFTLDLATVNGQLVVAKHTGDAQMAQDAMLRVADLHERLIGGSDTPRDAGDSGVWGVEVPR